MLPLLTRPTRGPAVVGIDPGLSGGIVGLDAARQVLLAECMPVIGTRKREIDLPALRSMLRELDTAHPGIVVFVESSKAHPHDGRTSAHRTGTGWGMLLGLLCGLELAHQVVQPRAWQTAVCRGLPKMDTKARTILAVQRRLPGLDLTPGRLRKPHTGLADAAGLALYGLSTLSPSTHT